VPSSGGEFTCLRGGGAVAEVEASSAVESPVTAMDIRIGTVIKCEKHPDADRYVNGAHLCIGHIYATCSSVVAVPRLCRFLYAVPKLRLPACP
jgi:hypothetical protein